MEQINSKQDLINYFEKVCKKENQLSVGVEHEKFIFNNLTNQRINFETDLSFPGSTISISQFCLI